MTERRIVTVTGEVSPSELGFCQCHEHILMAKGKSFEINATLCIDDPAKSEEEVLSYKAAGGEAIVEAQPVGCGRMADGLKTISEKTGVKIISSTGFHKMLFYPDNHWIMKMTAGQLENLFVTELTEGMYIDPDMELPQRQIAARAGQIKTAYDVEGLTDRYQVLFRGAAAAAKKTGAPMMIHIENGTDPRPLLVFLKEEGVNPKQLIFCHMDRACKDVEWHKEIASSGAYLEYDTIGRFKYHSDEREIEIMKEMIAAGYEDQLLFSLDTTRARLGAYGGDITLTYLIQEFIPQMKAAGIADAVIDKMAYANSAAAMSWK